MLVASVLERNDCIFFYEACFGLTEEIETNLAYARNTYHKKYVNSYNLKYQLQ